MRNRPHRVASGSAPCNKASRPNRVALTRAKFPLSDLHLILVNAIRPPLRDQTFIKRKIGEKNMRAPATVFRHILHKIASTLGSLQQPIEFTCGDCERWARCGMPSSDDCIFKAEQIARGDFQMKRLTKALSLTMGWPRPLERSKTKSIVDPEIW